MKKFNMTNTPNIGVERDREVKVGEKNSATDLFLSEEIDRYLLAEEERIGIAVFHQIIIGGEGTIHEAYLLVETAKNNEIEVLADSLLILLNLFQI